MVHFIVFRPQIEVHRHRPAGKNISKKKKLNIDAERKKERKKKKVKKKERTKRVKKNNMMKRKK